MVTGPLCALGAQSTGPGGICMPVLIIGVVFLALFLIMGVMSLSAVASEHRFQREVDEYKRATGIPTNGTNETVGLNSMVAGR